MGLGVEVCKITSIPVINGVSLCISARGGRVLCTALQVWGPGKGRLVLVCEAKDKRLDFVDTVLKC